MSEPNSTEWKELYQAAIAFQQAAPWKWMANEDVFAMVNPANGETGYCSILGNGGEEFGLGIFLGKSGLQHLLSLFANKRGADDPDETAMTPLLMFLLSDRDFLHEKDREVIRNLGLSFRGRNAWPLFRSQMPGYCPWFLEKGEATYLTVALRHAVEIALRVRTGELNLQSSWMGGKVLTHFLAGKSWKEEWRPLALPKGDLKGSEEPLEAVNEASLLLLKNRIKQLRGCWEVDMFVVPVSIGKTGSIPYHPLCFMVVECEGGLIVHNNMTEPWLTTSQKRKEIIRFLEKTRTLPLEVRVRSPKIKQILEPITGMLGMKLRVCRLYMIEEAKASLHDYLSKSH